MIPRSLKTLLLGALIYSGSISLQSRQSAFAPPVSGNGDGRFSFALVGDIPYGAEGEAKFPNLQADINADENLSFIVHDGDIKNGSSLCSDAMYYNRLDLFNAFRHPFIYVPGDNEWTDCHRANSGSYDPVERLAFLRAVFYPTDSSLGRRTLRLDRQSSDSQFAKFRENVRWAVNNVLFVGLHVVGSNNNLGRTPSADAEYSERNGANLAWLSDSFAQARSQGHKAVMIIIQANPNFGATLPTGFTEFLSALQTETINFSGPVVLVHGDSTIFESTNP